MRVSARLLVCTILLALFLGPQHAATGARTPRPRAAGHRRILEEYDPYLLDRMIAVAAAPTLVADIIYFLSSDTAKRLGTRWLVSTVPFPIDGISRFLHNALHTGTVRTG